MLSLSKTMRHTKLMDALKYERETTIIAKRKLAFYEQLTENELTNDILKHRWESLKEAREVKFTRSIVHEVKQIINDDSLITREENTSSREENASSSIGTNKPVEHLCMQNILGKIKEKLNGIKKFIQGNECDGISETIRYLLFDMTNDKKSLLYNLLSPFKSVSAQMLT